MEEKERDFKGVWIPKEVWLSKNLTLQEKAFMVEINSLDNENGCWASNDYFAEFFMLSKDRVKKIMKSLEEKNMITRGVVREKGSYKIKRRIIKVVSPLFNKCG
jgi:DNA-binding MarR family transcriptional regulator